MNKQLLTAGIVKMLYEKGSLRHISCGETEVVRRIYMALRDHNWKTFEPIITNEVVHHQSNSFKITYDCHHEKEGQNIFIWQVSIEGKNDGTIIFEINGEALENIWKNRAGFCVLHPPKTTKGQPCAINHVDGTITKTPFPDWVDPENPFKNIRSMHWQTPDNHWFSLDFEGDIFETEDQRNWTDASFKTFCTPLDLPFPVELKKGDKVWQKITFKPLEISQHLVAAKADNEKEIIQIEVTNQRFKLPEIGIGSSTEVETLSKKAIESLKKLHLNHYRIDVSPAESQWIPAFSHAAEQATLLAIPLAIALLLTENFKEEINNFVQVSLQNRLKIKQLLLLSQDKPTTSPAIIKEAIALKMHFPQTKIGAGTNYNFTELNRNRFVPEGLDFVSYAVQPQEHAFDNLTIVENLEGQFDTAVSAGHIYPNLPVHISPVTLLKRFNPSATVPRDRILTNNQKADPRQSTEFAAGWTLGSIKSLAEAGVETVTYYQTVGRQGILLETGAFYPIYEVLEKIQELSGGEIIGTKSHKPLIISTLLIIKGSHKRWFLVNHSDENQTIFMDKKVELRPFEVIFFDESNKS